jgi:hypothetical protein
VMCSKVTKSAAGTLILLAELNPDRWLSPGRTPNRRNEANSHVRYAFLVNVNTHAGNSEMLLREITNLK